MKQRYKIPLTGAWKDKKKLMGNPDNPVRCIPLLEQRPPELQGYEYAYGVHEIDVETGMAEIELDAPIKVHIWLEDLLISKTTDELHTLFNTQPVMEV